MVTTVVVADSEAITRRALRTTAEDAGYECLGEAADGKEALRLVLALQPNVLVLGLPLRRTSGLDVIRRLRRECAATAVVALAASETAHSIRLCAEAGAAAFVSKSAETSDVVLAIEAARRGRTWFPASATAVSTPERELLEALSARERLVLSYLVKGARLRQIAAELNLSESTVSTYKIRVLRKLSASSIVELAQIVERVSPHGWDMATSVKSGSRWADTHSELVRPLLDGIPFHVVIRNTDGDILFFNKFARDALGGRRKLLDSGSIREHARLLGVSDKVGARIAAQFREAAREGTSYRTELVVNRAQSLTAQLHWGGAIRSGEEIAAMICGNINIDELEHAIVSLREDAATSQEQFQQAHELNKRMLEAIRRQVDAFEKRLSEKGTDPDRVQLNFLRSIRSSAEHFNLLTRALSSDDGAYRESCTLRTLFETLTDDLRANGFIISLELADLQGAISRQHVLVRAQPLKDLITLLTRHAAMKGRQNTAVCIRLGAAPASRGLLDVEIEVSSIIKTFGRGRNDAVGFSRAQEGAVCKTLAARLGAELAISRSKASFHAKVELTLERSSKRED
jgi:DNA-binding NarL/FixJ family response regulator